MFNKVSRLRKNKEIEQVFKEGKAFYTDLCGLKVKENSLFRPRFAVVVGKKVSKKAVERNLIKRRIRASIKENIEQLNQKFDYVIIAKAGIKNKDQKEINQNLLVCFNKLGLIKK